MEPVTDIRYFFWLLPAETERAYYQNLIDELARRYEGPVFLPHITIYSGTFAPSTSPEFILTQTTAGFSPCCLQVEGIRYTDMFTKSLFVQLHHSQPLQALTEALRQHARPPADYVLDPHLSLLYQHLPDTEKEQLAASIQLPDSHITFDEVSVLTSSKPTRSPQDVMAWREVYRQNLSAIS